MEFTPLLDALQAEFSPPLDTSLIAAIVTDYVSEASPRTDPASKNVEDLRGVLAELAAQADKELLDEDALSGRVLNIHISQYSGTEDSNSSRDFFSRDTSVTETTTSNASSDGSNQHLLSSPVAFLHAAFPHIPISKLKSALASSQNDEDIDMESVVEGLLTGEYVRELEERGLEALNEMDMPVDYERQWQTVETKNKKATDSSSKKASKRGKTIPLTDIRQKHHTRPPTSWDMASPDPWTQLSSVASYLAALLPNQSASYFQSFFHCPDYTTPAQAVRAALRTISQSVGKPLYTVPTTIRELTPEETSSLSHILDISSHAHTELNAEERDWLIADAQLALRATRGQPDTALDLVWILRDLDSDSSSGEYAWSVYHAPAPPASASTSKGRTRPIRTSTLPVGPPLIPPPPISLSRTRSLSPGGGSTTSVSTDVWKTVRMRQPPQRGPHPLAESIPAYRRKVRGGGNGLGKGGKGDVGELSGGANDHRGRARELMAQSREVLREAGRAWQKGNSRTRGGEVAFYFAERARELQQQARQEQLGAAREMVQAKRLSSSNGDTVDLHGTTVSEAIQIVKDILHEGGISASKPLKIITGRGMHSANGIGVLGPAVKSALLDEGWTVWTWDGGLVVRAKVAERM
ncbi:hypothetical protein AcW2_005626 [Taiwanofungus camphoratus]|nr:hypothetical protein AcW2_005626 [Antrodia cinnamomea]